MFQGRAYTQFGGLVHQWTGSRLEPVTGSPRGQIGGMCVAGGYLCVVMIDGAASRWTLYAYDGVRWFVIETSGAIYNRIAGTGGLVSDGHLISLNFISQTMARWQFPTYSHITAANVRASGNVVVGPLDAGAGDAVKTWTRITVPWSTALNPSGLPGGAAAPANPGGNLLIEYSVDDGSNWVTVATVAIAAAARSGIVQQAIAGAGVEASRLLVRVTWTPTSAYAAFQINGVFADGWRIAEEPKPEEWTLTIKVSDRMIKRDGSVDARTGETMLQALRALAQSGATFTYQDIDYDLNARNVTARIVDLQEKSRKGDGTRFLESQVVVTLAAVG
jgi:hypothetical protein